MRRILTCSRVVHRTILVFSGVFTFLVDAYPTFAASALAANSFMRSSFGGIFPLFGIQSKFVDFPRAGGSVLCMQQADIPLEWQMYRVSSQW